MHEKKKAVFNWSGGKDSALALYKVLQSAEYDVISLLTTFNVQTLESSIHSIPLEIVKEQASGIGIPLYPILLPAKDMQGYKEGMNKAVQHFLREQVTHFIFGDIFLADVKKYREEKLNPFNIEVVEPLWNKTSQEVADDFIASGIRAKIIVTQADKLGKDFIGRELTRDFFESIPENVDPCGENGEYHTIAYGGPLFKKRINIYLSEPEYLSYEIKLDTGKTETFNYWHASVKNEQTIF